MMLKQAHLRTVIALIDRALSITDMIDEPFVAAHLAQALHVAERRLSDLRQNGG